MELNFDELAKQLETQELESAGATLPTVYSQLLALYLLQNDLNNAKYLWKRIAPATKTSTAELGQIWEVGQKLWQRDLPAVYQTLDKDWSQPVKPILAALLESTRARAADLVGQAYSSINAEDFSAFMGMPVPQAVDAAVARGWQADPQTRIIAPKPPERSAEQAIPNEKHLSQLTDFVSFLEN